MSNWTNKIRLCSST